MQHSLLIFTELSQPSQGSYLTFTCSFTSFCCYCFTIMDNVLRSNILGYAVSICSMINLYGNSLLEKNKWYNTFQPLKVARNFLARVNCVLKYPLIAESWFGFCLHRYCPDFTITVCPMGNYSHVHKHTVHSVSHYYGSYIFLLASLVILEPFKRDVLQM